MSDAIARNKIKSFSLALALSLMVAPAALAQSAAPSKPKPPDTNGLMIWPYQKLNATDGQMRDAAVLWLRSTWITPELGVNTIMNSFGAGTLRVMTPFPMPGGGTLLGMAGLRMTNMGNHPLNLSANFRMGPELAATFNQPLGGPWSMSVLGSYAKVFAANAGVASDPFRGQSTNLVFLGANLQLAVSPTAAVQVGVYDSFNVGDLQGLMFHNIGPTFTFVQRI